MRCLEYIASLSTVTETSCLGAIFTCSIYQIYDVAVTSYFGVVLTSPNQNIKIMSYHCMPTCFAGSLINTNGELNLTLTCLTYAIDAGNLDSLYSST